jgi:Fe-S oxidoreductase
MKKLFAAVKVSPRIITGGCIGKVLKVLGYLPEAKAAAEKFAAFLKAEGVKTLVVTNPAAGNALKQDYPEFGVKLPCEVKCLSSFVIGKGIKFKKAAGEVYALADDFMRNYEGCGCMERMLDALKAVNRPFGTNDEESYNCGEGAVVLDKLNPKLVKLLAEYVAARADDPKKDKIVVGSVYTKTQLVKYGKLNAVTVEELAASCL